MFDHRSRKLFDGYTPYGGIEFRADFLLSTEGGIAAADDPVTLATANAIEAKEYIFRPGKGSWVFTRMLILIHREPFVDIGKYGDNELVEGAIVSIKNSANEIIHRFNPKPICRVADWYLLAGADVPEVDRAFVPIRWTGDKAGIKTMLDTTADDYLSVNFPEAPVGLLEQYFAIQGNQIKAWIEP